jgi:HTH-type transcriptional regulator / antitoxin HigA
MEGTIMTLAIDPILTKRYLALQKQFALKPIQTRKEADAATRILDVGFRDSYDDPGEEAYMMVLADLLADYEDEHDRFESTATGLDVLQHMMEEHELKQGDIAAILGVGQSAVSQILKGTKPITAEHARRLGKRFNLNPGSFL